MNYKILLIKIFCLAAAAFAFVIIGFCFYDPYAFFHTRSYTKNHFHVNTKYGLKHIIDEKLACFDSLIFGTSMLRNTDARWLDKKDDRYANLSVDGILFKTRGVVLRYILAKKELKNVVYSLDQDFFFEKKRHNETSFGAFYDKGNIARLYQGISFYVSENTYWGCLLSFSKSKKCVGKKIDISLPNPLHVVDETKGIEMARNLEQDSTKLKIKQIFASKASKAYMDMKFANFKHDFLDLVARYPKTNFSVIIPPYSRLYWALNSYLFDQISMLKRIIKASKKYKNLKYYYFQNMDFTSNWRDFSYDLKHYRPWVNKLEIEAIKNKTHILDTSNLYKTMAKFKQNILEYDVRSLDKYYIPRWGK